MVIKRVSRVMSLTRLERDLAHAGNYAQWRELAAEHDRRSGAADWRDSDESELLHAAELRKSIATLRAMRVAGETWPLLKRIQDVLFRHQGELIHPELYQVSKLGTKRVVSEFLDEIEVCFTYLLGIEDPRVDDHYRIEQVKRIGRVYGRPALMLSGGGLLGLFHLGVVKALFEEDLLPRTISGSSMGSIVASWTCVHTDDELRASFSDLAQIPREALTRLPLREALAQRTVMDQGKLLAFLKSGLGDYTLAEAMQRSRRILNITVSPLNRHQTPRLINYLSAPEALVNYAVMASCAVPMFFKPVQLMARRRDTVAPWMEDELWIDGSVNGDLPFEQLRQMLNINHFITSQANPHVVPLLSLYAGGSDLVSSVARATSNIALHGAAQVLDVARRHSPSQVLRTALGMAHAISSQTYSGSDMHIQLPFRPRLYAKVLKNPTLAEFKQYVRLGEQTTWPRIEMVRDRTRLSRLFGNAIGMLMQRMKKPPRKAANNPPATRRKTP
jgi:TAG lipase/steryl ester hydrolase/phospholipase A2/LPA acyltransferase